MLMFVVDEILPSSRQAGRYRNRGHGAGKGRSQSHDGAVQGGGY